MQPLFTVSQWLVRVCGVLLLLSGLLFWTGDAPRTLVPVHMLLGIILVVALLVMAVLGAQAGVRMGLAIGAAVLALVVLALGWTQTTLMPGSTHWVIQALHLILGMAAVGIGEAIGGRVRRARLAPASSSSSSSSSSSVRGARTQHARDRNHTLDGPSLP